MAELFPDHDCVWVIGCVDSILKRKRKAFDREERVRQRFWPSRKPAQFYDSELAAAAALVQRAEQRVSKVRAELKREELRLAKCEKRLAAALKARGEAVPR